MKLLLGFSLFLLGQGLIWVQLNGQFVWPWFKRNPIFLSLGFGTVISYIFINATRITVAYYEGLLWPVRFIGFVAGILTFACLTHYLMHEAFTMKTTVSLILCAAILGVQVLWK